MSEAPKTKSAVKACGGEWEISHGDARKGARQEGPVQVATAAIKAGTPELQCKT